MISALLNNEPPIAFRWTAVKVIPGKRQPDLPLMNVSSNGLLIKTG
jgi:hypothetical protein